MRNDCGARRGPRPRRRHLAAIVVGLVVGLMVAPAAYADHLPAGVNVDPHPALGVPDPLGVPGASLGSLNLSTPGVLPDLPDIVPIMPTVSAISPAGSFPAIFIDTYVVPGSVLYRFDAVLGNIGGALDLYCASCNLPSQVLWQVVWEGRASVECSAPGYSAHAARVRASASGAI